MTSPLLATLGLSLMIPLSVFSDWLMGQGAVSLGFFAGTLAIFVGFLLENWAEGRETPALATGPVDGGTRRELGVRDSRDGVNASELQVLELGRSGSEASTPAPRSPAGSTGSGGEGPSPSTTEKKLFFFTGLL